MQQHDQSQAPILEALRQYWREDILPFSTPGHKQGRGVDEYTAGVLGRSTFEVDVAELAGYDDRHLSRSVKTRAEELAAQLYGADQCLFSTNGTSLSAHSAVLTVAGSGGKMLVARNFHKSVMAAMILADTQPVWMYPSVDEDFNVQHGVTPEQVEDCLSRNPDAKGVLVTSPDYFGVACRLSEIADVCHRHGAALIVDEAWGPHFPFHPDFPPYGMESGADICVGSVHKTMNGIQQSSIILARTGVIDMSRLMLCFDLFETTSSTSVIDGSTDGARRHMALKGEEVWGQALVLARRLRCAAGEIPGIRLLGPAVCNRPEASGLDETKVLMDVSGLGVTGMAAADWLRANRRITFELADQCHLLALVTLGDSDGTVDRLIEGLQAMAQWAKGQPRSTMPRVPDMAAIEPELVMKPRDAMLGRTRQVPLDQAPGQIAAEMISPYPPGIPAIAPGECFTEPIVEFLHAVQELKIAIPDTTDPELKHVRVVA